jgi:hypothetical protein
MKHRRSIDLSGAGDRLIAPIRPVSHYEHDGKQYDTLSAMRDWDVLGARCGACGHIAWFDHRAVLRRWGNQYLLNLPRRLVCHCGNRRDNKVLVGRLGRD